MGIQPRLVGPFTADCATVAPVASLAHSTLSRQPLVNRSATVKPVGSMYCEITTRSLADPMVTK
ncbi:unannotated protein [freshwater metagenome]|uniref:Unannotated protein n=1 Tax=freshwater metagenome TaxID=449393 RepID=A0A6J7KE37_9ZZZZ